MYNAISFPSITGLGAAFQHEEIKFREA